MNLIYVGDDSGVSDVKDVRNVREVRDVRDVSIPGMFEILWMFEMLGLLWMFV